MEENQTRKDAEEMLQYWQRRIARYVRRKRLSLGIKQDAAGKSRSAISEIENGKTNFRIGTLIAVLAELETDIPDVFASRVPKRLKPSHEHYHEMLEEIFQIGDETDVRFITDALVRAFSSLKDRK